jgi:hypothetical protein
VAPLPAGTAMPFYTVVAAQSNDINSSDSKAGDHESV